MRIGIGIDTGGTCTDAVAYDLDARKLLAKGKALTTHSCLEIGIGNALDTLPQEYIRDAELVSLSTTLATNACLEDKGSRTKLVIFGMTDELLKYLNIEKEYGIPMEKVRAFDTHGSADGLRPDVPDIAKIIEDNKQWLADADVLACSELYSSNNGAPCEKGFKAGLMDELGIKAVCAAEITDELNVIARGATSMLNARLLPIINDFISAILKDLQKRGCHGRISVVRSDGSMMNAAATLDKPVETILSGPAASVLAGKAFCEDENYLTVDMGGKPSPATGGIRLGQWRTLVQGVFASPFALGGDTHVWVDDKNQITELGVRRVKSICSAAVEWPRIKEDLARLIKPRDKHINRFHLHEFLYLLHRPERPEIYTPFERQLIDALDREGPIMLEDMEEKVGLDLYYFSPERLESEGIIMRIGMTPTDFMHIKGDYEGYDKEASVMGGRYLLACLGREDNEEELQKLADEVYDLVEERMYCNLVQILLRQLYPGKYEDLSEQMDNLIHRTWQTRNDSVQNPFVNQIFSTDMTLVGVGAPIHVFLPEVAKALGTRCVLSEDHDVANALGALQAKLSVVVRVSITQSLTREGKMYYIAHMPNGSARYDSYEEAVEISKKAAVRKVIEEATHRGATGELVPVVRAGNSTTKDKATGTIVRYGTVVEAEIEQEVF